MTYNNYTLASLMMKNEKANRKALIIKKVVLVFALIIIVQLTTFAQSVTDRIKLNQLGFYPNAPKLSIITGELQQANFYITSTNLRDTFFTGRLSDEMQSSNSSTKTRVADFSSLKKAGSYVVFVPGVGHSYVFKISESVNRDAAVSGLKGFYYQRVSMPLEKQFADKWHRGTGHPDKEVYIHPSAASEQRPAGSKISTPGGWYDAGDYNKYIVNSGISMGTMLSAYEDFPAWFDLLKTNIPESRDAVPDILNECIYNLRWMLTMQDPNDGGVYNKCTNASFDGMVMPGVTTTPRYVVQKGTAATLDFTAVCAQAARILKKYNKQLPGLSDSCLRAAVKAWQWSVKNPNMEYDQSLVNKSFDPDISSGGYGDKSFVDEWLWAAAEMFVTTRQKTYYDQVAINVKENINLPSWNNVGTLGYYTMVRNANVLPAYATNTAQVMKQQIIQFADGLVPAVSNNAFQTVMGQTKRDFNWGSSSNAANQGIALINAYQLTKDKKYIDYALTNLDYLLGRNATGYCFLTGAGSKQVMHPHHRPSVADGITEPVPGLLSGGPNPGKQDKCAYEFSEPETTFVDADCSYASNEIAINWNAPFVYLANAIEALQYKVNYSVKGVK